MTGRLAVVVPDLRVGGLQEMAVRLALSLDQDEFETHFYTFDGLGPLEADLKAAGVPATLVPRPPGLALAYSARLAERFVSDGIDLVHCHNVTALHHGARAAARARAIPVLFSEHDREMPAPWKHRLLHRWIVRYADRIVAVSGRLARDLVRFEGFPADRMETVFNGVPDVRAAWSGSQSEARAELEWPDGPALLAVGALTPVKNHGSLLAALQTVLQARPDARLYVAGIGPLQAELCREADRIAAGSVVWLGERRDVPRLLAAADVFVMSSHSEGLPLSLIEAHAAGRAAVCPDVGGIPEILCATDPGRSGWLAPPDDAAALGAALLEALSDPERLAMAGQAARARYERWFTHDRMVARYVELYRQLVPRMVA
jgi:glycosyltransferase involved in cell wall biosynthesis